MSCNAAYVLLLCAMPSTLTGCISSEVAMGYASAPATGRDAVAIHAREAIGEGRPWRIDNTVRARVGRSTYQVGWGIGPMLETPAFLDRRFILRTAAGVHLLEVGSVDNAFAFGMGTTYLEAGISWYPEGVMRGEEAWGFSASAGCEYDVRLSPQANEASYYLTLGLTWLTDSDARVPMMSATPSHRAGL